MMRTTLALLALLGTSVITPAQPSMVRITVRLVGVRPEKGGVIHAGVHREPGAGFPGPSPTLNRDVPPAGPEVQFEVDVAPGALAVAVHHDANGNGKVDTNFLGIPKEGYGVTNDPRPKLRAPRFAEGRVVATSDTTLVIRMVY